MFIHFYFVLLSKYEETIVHVLLVLRCFSDLSRHKEPQNGIYLNFSKMTKFESEDFVLVIRINYILKHLQSDPSYFLLII